MSASRNLAFRVAEQAIGLVEAVQMLLKPASSETHMPPEQLASWLDWLLLVRCLDKAVARSPTAVLRDLSAAAPQRVCSKTFSHGDVIWKCRTCQVGDDTCVVCQACFQDADHQGHDVSFYISRQECPALAPGTHHCRHCSHFFSHAAFGLTVQPSASAPPAPAEPPSSSDDRRTVAAVIVATLVRGIPWAFALSMAACRRSPTCSARFQRPSYRAPRWPTIPPPPPSRHRPAPVRPPTRPSFGITSTTHTSPCASPMSRASRSRPRHAIRFGVRR